MKLTLELRKRILANQQSFAFKEIFSPSPSVGFLSAGQLVFVVNSRFQGYDLEYVSGLGELSLVINNLLLLPGFYETGVHVHDKQSLGFYDIESVLFFVKEGRRGMGVYYQPHAWE